MICMIKEPGTLTVRYQDVFMDPAFRFRNGRKEEINRKVSFQTLNRLRKIVRKLLPHAKLLSYQCSDGDDLVPPGFIRSQNFVQDNSWVCTWLACSIGSILAN